MVITVQVLQNGSARATQGLYISRVPMNIWEVIII
jgi:hypothetical protein